MQVRKGSVLCDGDGAEKKRGGEGREGVAICFVYSNPVLI